MKRTESAQEVFEAEVARVFEVLGLGSEEDRARVIALARLGEPAETSLTGYVVRLSHQTELLPNAVMGNAKLEDSPR